MNQATRNSRRRRAWWAALLLSLCAMVALGVWIAEWLNDGDRQDDDRPETDERGNLVAYLGAVEEIPRAWREGYLYPHLDELGGECLGVVLTDDDHGPHHLPPRIEIEWRFSSEGEEDFVRLWTVIDRSDDENPIPGYVEQGKELRMADTVIHHCRVEGAEGYEQARFYYVGTLYVLHVESDGEEGRLMHYLKILLGEEAPEGA